jgi:ADP-heptose:LPS heptosyltransferase
MSQNLIRKFLSAVKHRVIKTYLLIQSFLIAVITDKYWLLDLVPKRRADIQSVMLIRLDVIGDFVLWLDSAKAYRRLFPNKKIVLYANSSWIELARQLTHWDEVVSIDMVQLREDELYRLRTFYKIHRRGFPIAIQPTYSREYMADMLTRSSGAEEIIGFDCDLSNILPAQKDISDRWYSRLIKTESEQRMELTRNADFIRSLGLKDFVSDVPKISPILELPAQLQINAPYIVIFPGASWVPKMWPSCNFAALIEALNTRYGLLCVLCGGSSEYELCSDVIAQSRQGSTLNFAGLTKLTELVEIIRNAQFLFANDTSAIHIAAAVQTPSVCVLGGGHYGRFLPYEIEDATSRKVMPRVSIHQMDCYHCNWSCIHTSSMNETVPCINNIAVQDVLTQYEVAIKE